MLGVLLKVATVAGFGWMFLNRDKAVTPSAGGAFVEVKDGIQHVRIGAVAWTLARLREKFIAPTPAGADYAQGTAYGQIRSDGGMVASAWANQKQSEGLDVAISINAGNAAAMAAGGILACFPPSEKSLWCEQGKDFAILLRAAPRPVPRPS